MATTHAAMGSLLALPVAAVAPEFAPAAALAGIAGGYFPDLDLLGPMEHRKTLHFPEYYTLLSVPFGALALLSPTDLTVALAVGVLSAAVHSLTDVFGGGLGKRPWSNDDERGVYYHYGRRWLRPRRWVRYDGAPEDLLAVAVLSVPGVLAFEGAARTALVAGVAVSALYTLVRKRLPDLAERLV